MSLVGARIQDNIVLDQAIFGNHIDFRGADIGALSLDNSHSPQIISARVDFRGASIANTLLTETLFTAGVDFSGVSFGDSKKPDSNSTPLTGRKRDSCVRTDESSPLTRFQFVTFEQNVSFRGARFCTMLDFDHLTFNKAADFTGADFDGIEDFGPRSFRLSNVQFEDLRIQWEQLPNAGYWAGPEEDKAESGTAKADRASLLNLPPEPISRTMRQFEKLFRQQGLLDDANAAYYSSKRAQLFEARSGDVLSERIFREMEWLFWGLVSGYGTKLWWVFGWSTAIIFLFALFYYCTKAISWKRQSSREFDFDFKLRLLDLPDLYIERDTDAAQVDTVNLTFATALRASTVIFTKVGRRNMIVSRNHGKLVYVEWWLGLIFVAVFTVTLTNTQPLFNRLLAGLF